MTGSRGDRRGALLEAYEALRQGCVVVERPELGCLELVGEDRSRFLNGMMTCDVGALEAGEGAYGFFTDVKGRILADAVVAAAADSLRLSLPRSAAGRIEEHLSKHIIADRVEVRLLEASVWTLAGPGSEARLEEELAPPPTAPWTHAELAHPSGSLLVSVDPRFGLPAFALVARSPADAAAAAALASADVDARRAFEALRVEAGVPAFGVDFDSEHLPQETGREDAVSYTKGCYLGQEVVARIHYLGEPARVLRGLALAGDSVPETPAGLALDGREVGRLTSAEWSPSLDRPIGLGILKRRAAEAGTGLTLEGGSPAQVVDLPFQTN